ncbi:MAG: hypothetical protein IKG34_01990 [Solobacterium sp.]|nr:hypothetical protein [Solobacterium sp.]
MRFERSKAAEYMVYIILFLFFVLIFHWSPLAGDDWVYASEVRYSNAFAQTAYAYMTWSGRVLSEFWGFVFTDRKIIWEISGAFLMVVTVWAMLKLNRKQYRLADVLFTVFLVLTVPRMIRTQTYTFAVGFAAYTIPIPLWLIHLSLLKGYLLEDRRSAGNVILMCVLSIAISLHMENMSVLIAFTNFAAVVYALYMKKCDRNLWIVLGCTAAACLVMFLAPGTSVRLEDDFSQAQALDLMRIINNWKPFLYMSLYFADAVNTCLCVILIIKFWFKENRSHADLVCTAVFAAELILTWINGFSSPFIDTLWCIIWYGTLIYALRYDVLHVFLVLGCLAADGIMVLSPSFPERTAVYGVYCMIALASLLLRELPLRFRPEKALTCLCAAGVLLGFAHFGRIYYQVHLINIVRIAQVRYYQKRPDAGEAWFLAYPLGTIHSANIDYEEDVDHIWGFKEYYYLNQDLHLNFYYLDNYDRQSIMAELPEE